MTSVLFILLLIRELEYLLKYLSPIFFILWIPNILFFWFLHFLLLTCLLHPNFFGSFNCFGRELHYLNNFFLVHRIFFVFVRELLYIFFDYPTFLCFYICVLIIQHFCFAYQTFFFNPSCIYLWYLFICLCFNHFSFHWYVCRWISN